METKTPKPATPEEKEYSPKPFSKTAPLALTILNDLKLGILEAERLSQEHRRLCVRQLLHEGKWTTYEMQNIFKVCRSTIMADKRFIRSENSYAQMVVDESEIAIEMLEEAERCATKLIEYKRFKDAWTVRRECVEVLQSLGYIKKAPTQLAVGSLLEMLNLERRQSNTAAEQRAEGYAPLPDPERVEDFKN